MAEGPQTTRDPPRGIRSVLLRILLGALTTLVSLNLWTGGPLLALWVGSKIQAGIGTLSMAAVAATIGVLIVETYILYKCLALLSARYNAVIGREVPRQQAAWLRPMSAERRTWKTRAPPTTVERIVMIVVVVAFECLLVWFFFFAHYRFAG